LLPTPPQATESRARPQGVNVARVLRLAGAARRLLTAGSSQVGFKKDKVSLPCFHELHRQAKGFCRFLLSLQRKFSSEFLK